MIANRFNPLGKRTARPYAYRVEYLESYNDSTGVEGNGEASQHLVIPIMPKLADETYIRFSKLRGRDSAISLNFALFGGGYNFRNRYYGNFSNEMWIGSSTKVFNSWNVALVANKETPLELLVKDKIATMTRSDGGVFVADCTSLTAEEPNTDRIVVGGLYISSSKSVIYKTKFRIHEFWMKRDGEFLVHLLPCVDLDGRPACYDEVSGELYYNSGNKTYEYLVGERI